MVNIIGDVWLIFMPENKVQEINAIATLSMSGLCPKQDYRVLDNGGVAVRGHENEQLVKHITQCNNQAEYIYRDSNGYSTYCSAESGEVLSDVK